MRKIAWVRWENVCKPKKEGGLGVRDVTKFNAALLGKWRWRLLVETKSLWVKVVSAKYGRGVILGEQECFAVGSVWWRDLGKICAGVAEEQGWLYSKL